MGVAVNDISCVEPADVSDRHLHGTTSPREDGIPWAAMAGIIATVTVFAVAQGLTYPLLS